MWPVLLVIAGFAGVTYAWGIANSSLELFYEAAVRSMGSSWHDFVFGSFDPAGTISVDKLPGALWLQALSVRVFGFHVWVIVLPQVVEGVLTVLVLFRAVERVAGPVAGAISAALLAVSPATVALDRGNISDSLLILLLVLAADAMTAALTRLSTRWLLLAGLWVGLAFQAKMLQAWLVLPALAVAWVLAAPGPLYRRAVQFAGAALVAIVVSMSWMSAVSLVPHSGRPYVDGSTSDSLFQQVFEYNGFGRAGQSSPADKGGLALYSTLNDFRLPNGPGPGRLLSGAGGRDIGWLVPAAVLFAVAVVLERRRKARDDLLRAACVLWVTWLIVYFAVFSVISPINAYYEAALSPAIGALCGITFEVFRRPENRGRTFSYGVLGMTVASVVYAIWLSAPASHGLLVPLAVGAAVLVGATAWFVVRRRDQVMATALAAVALFPAAASLEIVAGGLGPFDTPYQSADVTHITQVEPKEALADLEPELPLLIRVNRNDRFVSATYSSTIAAPLIVDTGKEIEPIGGFTGSIPYPSVSDIRRQVDSRELQTVITPDVADPRVSWVRSHCTFVPTISRPGPGSLPISGIDIYFCGPVPDTAPGRGPETDSASSLAPR